MIETAETRVLRDAYRCALDAAAPARLLPAQVEALGMHGPAVVLGAGKAAASMAVAFRASWRGPARGMVVTRYGHGLLEGESAGEIEVLEAAHPLPDSASVDAGMRMLGIARSLTADERLFFLISGGGSALAAAPLEPIGFERKRAAADFLIRAGADIREINCVRRHLSGLKGGRLAAAAHPAPVVTFAISDVPGDDVAAIASGPTVPDGSTPSDAIAVLEKYAYPELTELSALLDKAAPESPKPADPGFDRDQVHLIASAATALDAAATLLRKSGYRVIELGDDLDGEAQTLGREHARVAKAERRDGEAVAILSGGETRVVLGASGGRGGRNLEYLAGLALELDDEPGIVALAADTDGIDGHGDHAGGIIVPGMLELGRRRGVALEQALEQHDSYRFFDACGALIRTGPTRTNVNDFRLIICQSVADSPVSSPMSPV